MQSIRPERHIGTSCPDCRSSRSHRLGTADHRGSAELGGDLGQDQGEQHDQPRLSRRCPAVFLPGRCRCGRRLFVDLCTKIADQVKSELKLEKLTLNWVPVTAEDRFSAVQQGKVDLLCGADSTTLTRRKDVSFSIPILPSGIGAVLRAGHPVLREVLSDVTPSRPIWRGSPARTLIEAQTFAVIAGTTSEKVLTDRINKFEITATVIKVDSYDAGIRAVLDGTANVFFGDRLILLDAVKRSPLQGDLVVLDRLFTNEPHRPRVRARRRGLPAPGGPKLEPGLCVRRVPGPLPEMARSARRDGQGLFPGERACRTSGRCRELKQAVWAFRPMKPAGSD